MVILTCIFSIQHSYKAAQCQLNSLHQGWKRVLVNRTDDHHHITAVKQLESAVSLYLKKTSSAHSPTDIIAVRESKIKFSEVTSSDNDVPIIID